MKVVIAITAAIAAAATTAAIAGHSIKVDESKVSAEAKASAKIYLDESDLAKSDEAFASLVSALDSDLNALPLDVKVILAAGNIDSTTRHNYNPQTTGGCYSNCYSNCHGSRSWR